MRYNLFFCNAAHYKNTFLLRKSIKRVTVENENSLTSQNRQVQLILSTPALLHDDC